MAESNQGASDLLYQDALKAYGNAGISELLYLSAYPFVLSRPVGPAAQSTYFTVPAEFIPTRLVQRLFLEAMLRRSNRSLEVAIQPTGGPYRLPEPAQIYLAFRALEPLILLYQPTYLERVLQAKAIVGALISLDVQAQVASIWLGQQEVNNPLESFSEKSEQERNPDKKDQFIAQAVLAAKDTESLDRVESLAEKVSDSKLREQLLDWLYFKRAQGLIKDGLLDEATKFAKKVEAIDHRAYLMFQIASEAIKRLGSNERATELLDEVAKTALKAPNTIEKARTLLGIAYAYAKLDRYGALNVMGNAVKTINDLSEPELATATLFRRIEGRQFTIYARYDVPGFSIENVFRDLGTYDFDNALWLSNRLENKPLRLLTVLALSELCLRSLPEQHKPKRKRREKISRCDLSSRGHVA